MTQAVLLMPAGCTSHTYPAQCTSQAADLHRSWSGSHKARLRVQTSVRAFKSNPQNVDNPAVMPDKDMSAQQAVEAQLKALQTNNEPWCGLCCFEWCNN